MGKAKRFNEYDRAVSESRRTIENYGRERQIFSTGSSFRSAPFQPETPSTSTSSSSSATFGLGDPIILTEINLGDITGAVNVDWSLANKFRGRLVGNTTISFINTPPNAGFYQQIILELRQDGTGDRTVTWADSFENDHTPLVAKEADDYNVWAFYASNRGTEPIFSFNTYQSIALQYALSDEDSQIVASALTPAVTFRSPFAMTVTDVRASLTNASVSGTTIVDIQENGASILSTLLSIDVAEKTSVSAATPAVISDNDVADDSEMKLFVTSAGTNATGLKVTLRGYIS